jgi:hypothetical protein
VYVLEELIDVLVEITSFDLLRVTNVGGGGVWVLLTCIENEYWIARIVIR